MHVEDLFKFINELLRATAFLNITIKVIEKYADLLMILVLILILEFIALVLSAKKIEQSNIRLSVANNYSKLYRVLAPSMFFVLSIALILVKYHILLYSYHVSISFTGLEPLLSSLVIVLTAYLMFMALAHEVKVHFTLFLSLIFGVIYVLSVNPLSQSAFTDRILAATYVVEKGVYVPGLLDEAYNPIPFDISIYSFIALILGIDPSNVLIFMIYPTLSLTITYAITWLLIIRLIIKSKENHNTIKMAFVTIFLLQLSCWTLTITSHEALWSAWLLATVAMYNILKILKNMNIEFSSIITLQIFLLASVFYHVTTLTLVLPLMIGLTILVLIYDRSQITQGKNLFLWLISYLIILSYVKDLVAGYLLPDFLLLLKRILTLQFSEELNIYVRTSILETNNSYLRYAQASPFLIIALSVSSTIFYLAMLLRKKMLKSVKERSIAEDIIGLSLGITGFVLLLISFLSTFIPGVVFNTTFIRPALFLLLLSNIPYIIKRYKRIGSSKLVLVHIVTLLVIVGVAVNDVNITSRKGLFSPFIYVNDFDKHNLQFLKHVIEDNILIVGSEASIYSWYLNIVHNRKLAFVASMKNIRNIYMYLHESGTIPRDSRELLLTSIKEFSVRHILSLSDETSTRIYDSDVYVIHYIS
jgi:hypothetical protein